MRTEDDGFCAGFRVGRLQSRLRGRWGERGRRATLVGARQSDGQSAAHEKICNARAFSWCAPWWCTKGASCRGLHFVSALDCELATCNRHCSLTGKAQSKVVHESSVKPVLRVGRGCSVGTCVGASVCPCAVEINSARTPTHAAHACIDAMLPRGLQRLLPSGGALQFSRSYGMQLCPPQTRGTWSWLSCAVASRHDRSRNGNTKAPPQSTLQKNHGPATSQLSADCQPRGQVALKKVGSVTGFKQQQQYMLHRATT